MQQYHLTGPVLNFRVYLIYQIKIILFLEYMQIQYQNMVFLEGELVNY